MRIQGYKASNHLLFHIPCSKQRKLSQAFPTTVIHNPTFFPKHSHTAPPHSSPPHPVLTPVSLAPPPPSQSPVSTSPESLPPGATLHAPEKRHRRSSSPCHPCSMAIRRAPLCALSGAACRDPMRIEGCLGDFALREGFNASRGLCVCVHVALCIKAAKASVSPHGPLVCGHEESVCSIAFMHLCMLYASPFPTPVERIKPWNSVRMDHPPSRRVDTPTCYIHGRFQDRHGLLQILPARFLVQMLYQLCQEEHQG